MIATPIAATGRFIQKITRQSISISTPPASGPIPSATAETAAQIPSARGCSADGKALQTSASESDNIGAAPAPCSTRPTINPTWSPAAPETTDPTAKTPIPTMKTRLRPNMSPSRPAVTTSTAIVSRYPFITHCSPSELAPTSPRISGSASATTVESSISRNSPEQAPARVHHLRFTRAAYERVRRLHQKLVGEGSGRPPFELSLRALWARRSGCWSAT